MLSESTSYIITTFNEIAAFIAMRIPDVLSEIEVDVSACKTRRAKVRTLLGWYGLKRRGGVVRRVRNENSAEAREATS